MKPDHPGLTNTVMNSEGLDDKMSPNPKFEKTTHVDQQK